MIDNETSIHLSTTSEGLNIQSIYVAMGICPYTAWWNKDNQQLLRTEHSVEMLAS